jgi:hypothetical protein
VVLLMTLMIASASMHVGSGLPSELLLSSLDLAEVVYRLNDIYQAVLGRSIYSDASGKATWRAELAKPGQTLTDVRRKIVFDPGPEAIAHLNDIYQAVLGRSMNDGEWQTQTTRLAQGGTLEQCAAPLRIVGRHGTAWKPCWGG